MGMPVAEFVDEMEQQAMNVLVVSSNPKLRESLQERLSQSRWNVMEAVSGAGALEILYRDGSGCGVLLLDPMLPDLDPGEFHAMIKSRFPSVQVVTLNSRTGQLMVGETVLSSASQWVLDAVNASGGSGAGIEIGARREAVGSAPRECERLRGMVGDSEPMRRAYELTRMVAVRDTTVLVTGESGTGKDLIAQEIHQISARRKQPFVVVNCSAIPESLLEAELFGYTKGAFTGRCSLGLDAFTRRTEARCFSMRLETCRFRCRASCCDSWSRAKCSGWAVTTI